MKQYAGRTLNNEEVTSSTMHGQTHIKFTEEVLTFKINLSYND